MKEWCYLPLKETMIDWGIAEVIISFNSFNIYVVCTVNDFVKKVSSSTAHKKTPSLRHSENLRKIFLAHLFLSKPNPFS